MSRILIGLCLASLFWASCKTTRIAETTPFRSPEPDELWLALDTTRFDYRTFSAKADVEMEDESGKSSAIAFLRMQRDSVIWISLRKAGLEGARVLITRDSVHILDRNEKAYYPFAYDYLRQQFRINLPFEALQDLIVGNAMVRQPLDWQSGLDNGRFTLAGQDGPIDHQFWIRPADLRLTGQAWMDPTLGLGLDMQMDDYEMLYGQAFATFRTIVMPGERPATFQIRFSRILTNESDLSFSFNVSPSYQVIRELR